MSELGRKHIQIVEAVNNAQTESEHERSKAVLQGFREALKIIAPSFGAMLMDCDNHYLEQGIDRDMCCGEFLDWKPILHDVSCDAYGIGGSPRNKPCTCSAPDAAGEPK